MSAWTRIGMGIGAVVLMVGLSAGVYVSAQDAPGAGPGGSFGGRRGGPGGPGRFGGPGGRGGAMDVLGPMMGARLNLSDAQRDQVRAVMDSHRDEMRVFGDRAMETQRALEAAITADTLDEGLIRARANDRAAVEADLAVMRARIHGEVWNILTAEQKAQAKEMQANMQKRLEGRRDRRQDRQPPQ
jgi:Spy/CpxP family protein refolding chaperone